MNHVPQRPSFLYSIVHGIGQSLDIVCLNCLCHSKMFYVATSPCMHNSTAVGNVGWKIWCQLQLVTKDTGSNCLLTRTLALYWHRKCKRPPHSHLKTQMKGLIFSKWRRSCHLFPRYVFAIRVCPYLVRCRTGKSDLTYRPSVLPCSLHELPVFSTIEQTWSIKLRLPNSNTACIHWWGGQGESIQYCCKTSNGVWCRDMGSDENTRE